MEQFLNKERSILWKRLRIWRTKFKHSSCIRQTHRDSPADCVSSTQEAPSTLPGKSFSGTNSSLAYEVTRKGPPTKRSCVTGRQFSWSWARHSGAIQNDQLLFYILKIKKENFYLEITFQKLVPDTQGLQYYTLKYYHLYMRADVPAGSSEMECGFLKRHELRISVTSEFS